MTINLRKYLNKLRVALPKVCTDEDLVEHAQYTFTSLRAVEKRRSWNQIPPYFYVRQCFFYKRDDVIDWLENFHGDEALRDFAMCRIELEIFLEKMEPLLGDSELMSFLKSHISQLESAERAHL